MENLEYRIAKLSLDPGDVLVIKVDHVISVEMAQRIKNAVLDSIDHRRTIVLDSQTELAVLTSSEIEARAAA